MRTWITSVFCIVVIFLVSAGTGWCVEVEKVEEKTFRFSPGGSISVTADESSIIVTTWNKESVHIKMTKRAWGRNRREAERILNDIEVRIQEGRDRLVIKELGRNYDDDFNFFDLFDSEFWREKGWRSGVVDFELTVPEEVRLRLNSDEGDVEVSGVHGRLTVELDEGDVEIEDVVADNIQIGVDEGDISLYRVKDIEQGLWKIDTDEGSIYIEDSSVKEVDGSTDEGEIILRNIATTRFWLSSDEGDIQVDFQPMEEGSYRMETDEGDLEIYIPVEGGLQVKLQTYEGRIDSDFDLRIREYDDGESAEGVIGQNMGFLKAFTDEGDIILRQG